MSEVEKIDLGTADRCTFDQLAAAIEGDSNLVSRIMRVVCNHDDIYLQAELLEGEAWRGGTIDLVALRGSLRSRKIMNERNFGKKSFRHLCKALSVVVPLGKINRFLVTMLESKEGAALLEQIYQEREKLKKQKALVQELKKKANELYDTLKNE